MDKRNLEVVLRSLGSNKLNYTDNWIMTACPLAEFTHEKGKDKHPSFGVSIIEGEPSVCNCFACGFRGTLLELVNSLKQHTGKDYSRLIKLIEQKDSSFELPEFEDLKKKKIKKEELKDLPEKGYDNIFCKALSNREAVKYLIKRRVSKQAAKLLELRFDETENRILFPVKDKQGKLYGYTGRCIYNNPVKIKDYIGLKKSKLLLGEHLYKKGKPIILVEGLFALARLISIGVLEESNVMASMGKSLDYSQADRLINFGESVFLLYDPDQAGREGIFGIKTGTKKISGAMQKLINHIPVFIPNYPKGIEDPDDLTLDHIKNILKNTNLFNNFKL